MSSRRQGVSLLLPSVGHTAVVVVATPDGVCLPRFALEPTEDDTAVMIVSQLVRDQLDVSPVVLETHLPSDATAPATDDPLEMLAVLDALPEGWMPPVGLSWHSVADPSPTAPAGIAARAQAWVEEWRTGAAPPRLRPSWSRPGWLARATTWMAAALDHDGRPIEGPIEVRRLWGISALLHARTAGGGGAWLKAVFPRFGHEPAVTQFLEQVVPGAVPHVIAIDLDEGWLLLDDVAGTEVSREPDAILHEIQGLVRVQQALVGREDELMALGCPARPMSALADELEQAVGGAPQLPGVDLAPDRLSELVTWVRAQAERLAELGLPDVVVHGDFHPGNVILTADGLVFIDWSDAAVAHPLMDVGPLLSYVEKTELGARCWETWLDSLASLGPVELLRGEMSAVIGLAVAFQVVSLGHILRDLEPANRYQLSDDLHAFLHSLDERVPR